jgi:isopentenyl diphosphate isomerase/L-lactate dehydrogenase-like FMN-dependent dehydrogenase
VSAALTSIEDARRRAARVLPPAVYAYLDGGKEAEQTALANELAFGRVLFSPRIGHGALRPSTAVELFGERLAMPVVIAPTGMIRIAHQDGELGAARAAARAGIPIAISHVCGAPAAAVVAENPSTWFQLYLIGGRDGVRETLALVRAAGCRVLVVTVDVAGVAPRDRLARPLPTQLSLGAALPFLAESWNRPRWLAAFLAGGLAMPTPNAPRRADGTALTLAELGGMIGASAPTWEELGWLRDEWSGPLVIKGILRSEDARRAADLGADGISVSNHGAKVLDGTPATISVLPEIADAVGGRLEILLDGGIRRGADVVRACALGAKAVMIGRPYLWGLAAGGEAGVAEVLALLRGGIRATLANLGCGSIAELDRSFLRPLPGAAAWNETGMRAYERLWGRSSREP